MADKSEDILQGFAKVKTEPDRKEHIDSGDDKVHVLSIVFYGDHIQSPCRWAFAIHEKNQSWGSVYRVMAPNGYNPMFHIRERLDTEIISEDAMGSLFVAELKSEDVERVRETIKHDRGLVLNVLLSLGKRAFISHERHRRVRRVLGQNAQAIAVEMGEDWTWPGYL